jgi:hypothetical protein
VRVIDDLDDLILFHTACSWRQILSVTQTAGSTSNSPFLQEVEFYIEGATKDLPDGSYRYPCGP